MGASTGIMSSLMVAALSACFGLFAALAWRRHWKQSRASFFTFSHPTILFLSIICWSLVKVVLTIVSAAMKNANSHPNRFALTQWIAVATLFMVCFTSYLGCWSDIHIHGHVSHDAYRSSRAPWYIFYVTTAVALFSGWLMIFFNTALHLPPFLTLEIWTTVNGGLLVLTSIGVALYMWRKYPSEQSRSKRISMRIQTSALFFLCICFAMRQRMIWFSSAYLAVSFFQQLTRFVYLAAEWMAIGAMLIFCFPRARADTLLLPNSEVVRHQWQRTKIVSGIVTLVSTIATFVCLALLLAIRGEAGRESPFFLGLNAFATVACFCVAIPSLLIFICSFIRNQSHGWATRLIRLLAITLIAITSLIGGYCFAIVMSLMIAVPPFNHPPKALIGTAVSSTAVVAFSAYLCSVVYRLSSYVKDWNSIDIIIDHIDIEEQYETPNKELEDQAGTIQKFLLVSLALHSLWIVLYFTPASSATMKNSVAYGWVTPLVTTVFVIARLPISLFGFVSTNIYRRDSTRLRVYLISETTLNVFGIGIIGLQTYFWLCSNGGCTYAPGFVPPPFSSSQKTLFLISTILVLLLIFEAVINGMFYVWYKKVRASLTSLILEDINNKVDAMF